jgi:hypothetical protein
MINRECIYEETVKISKREYIFEETVKMIKRK